MSASKILQRRWERESWESHQKRLAQIRPQIQTNNLVMHNLSASKHGKKQLLRDLAFMQIQKENELLVKRIANVRPATTTTTSNKHISATGVEVERCDAHAYGPDGVHSLNARVRRQELLHIMRENKRIVSRIENRKPVLDRSEWEKHAHEHESHIHRLAGGTVELPPIRNMKLMSKQGQRPHTTGNVGSIEQIAHAPAQQKMYYEVNNIDQHSETPKLMAPQSTEAASYRKNEEHIQSNVVKHKEQKEIKISQGNACIYDEANHVFPSDPASKSHVTVMENLLTRVYQLTAITVKQTSDSKTTSPSKSKKLDNDSSSVSAAGTTSTATSLKQAENAGSSKKQSSTEMASITIDHASIQNLWGERLRLFGLFHSTHRAQLGKLLANCLDIEDGMLVFVKPNTAQQSMEAVGMKQEGKVAIRVKGRNIPRLRSFRMCNPVVVIWMRHSQTGAFLKVGFSNVERNTYDPDFSCIVIDISLAGWITSGEGIAPILDQNKEDCKAESKKTGNDETKTEIKESEKAKGEQDTKQSKELATPLIKICVYDASNQQKITNNDLICTSKINLNTLYKARDETIRRKMSKVDLHNAYMMVTASGTPKIEFQNQQQESALSLIYPAVLPLFNAEGSHALGGNNGNAKSSIVVDFTDSPASRTNANQKIGEGTENRDVNKRSKVQSRNSSKTETKHTTSTPTLTYEPGPKTNSSSLGTQPGTQLPERKASATSGTTEVIYTDTRSTTTEEKPTEAAPKVDQTNDVQVTETYPSTIQEVHNQNRNSEQASPVVQENGPVTTSEQNLINGGVNTSTSSTEQLV